MPGKGKGQKRGGAQARTSGSTTTQPLPTPSFVTPSGDETALVEKDIAEKVVFNFDHLKESLALCFGTLPQITPRAPQGKAGRPVDLISNLFEIQLPHGRVFHYDVSIFSIRADRGQLANTDKVPTQLRDRCASTLKNRLVIAELSRSYSRELSTAIVGFDGRKNLYTRRALPSQNFNITVKLTEQGEVREYYVVLKYAKTVSFDEIHAMYSKNGSVVASQDAVQAADIILRTAPTLHFVPVGRSFFSPPSREDGDCVLSNSREVWFGFYSSIRLGSWKPLVNIDMSATAFYIAQPLIDFIKERVRNQHTLNTGFDVRDRAMILKEILKLFVILKHLDKKRKYRIEGFSRLSAKEEKFVWENRTVSVAQYFSEKYKIHLKYPNLPCIEAGKNRIKLPIEVCRLAEGQHCKKKLSEIETSNMIRKTAVQPRDRFRRIMNAARDLKSQSQPFCDEFDMKLTLNPVEVQGRVLPTPQIQYGSGKTSQVSDGSWKFSSTFMKPANMTRWAIAVLGRVSQDRTRNVIQLFRQKGQSLGMQIAEPAHVMTYDRRKPYDILSDVKRKVPDVEMTLVMLSPYSDYGLLKAEAETSDLCMRTQCVKDVNVERKFNPMFAENLLQKINTKLGGQNNAIHTTSKPDGFRKPFMAIGIDVNHAGPGDKSTPSIATLVASMDAIPAQYYAVTSVQQKEQKGQRVEWVVELSRMFRECLDYFQAANKLLPQRLYIFRDGVSEPQFDGVRMYELRALREACQSLRKDYTPPMVFIVVQKRHHVRFMPKNDRDGSGKCRNIPPGTLVDSKIVNPGCFDFYLCAHQGIQGTSRPAHYHVVHDDINHPPDEIYKMCYYLCHTYARCTRTVSLPAPAYYAHLAAFRAKEYIKGKILGGSSTESVLSASSGETKEQIRKFQEITEVVQKMKGMMYFV